MLAAKLVVDVVDVVRRMRQAGRHGQTHGRPRGQAGQGRELYSWEMADAEEPLGRRSGIWCTSTEAAIGTAANPREGQQ